jgi:hypothetical protein
MSTDTAILLDIRDRMVRVESRLVQLGDYVGANLRTRQKIGIEPSSSDTDVLVTTVDSLDVSIARIYAEMATAGYAGVEANVFVKGEHVATLYSKPPS